IFANVQPPVLLSNAPVSTLPAGRNRKRNVYAKNGSVTIHARGRRLRPDITPGRRASGAASTAMVLGPDLRRPLRRDERLGPRLLARRGELHLRVDLRVR